MLWNFNLFYHSSSIQEMKHVLRPNSRFLKVEARNNSLNGYCQPLQTDDKKPSSTKTLITLWSAVK